MIAFDKLTSSQKVRAAIHRDVRTIASETCHFLGLEVTKPAMEIIAELVYKKLSTYGTDLEAFAKHAKRTVINSEDVKLLARRNPSLLAHLNTIVPAPNPTTTKRRKTTAKPQETPAKTAEVANKNKEDPNANKEHKSTEQIEKENSVKANSDAVEDMFENMAVDDMTIDLTFD